MAFTTNPYCTLFDVKAALDLSKNTSDSFIGGLIIEAQNYIDEYVGYPFQIDGTISNPATRVYDGNDHQKLFIDHCLSFSQVLETVYDIILGANDVFEGVNTQTIDITSDCYLLPNNQVVRNKPYYMLSRKTGNIFGAGQQNYVVKGVFGYPVIPPDITRACIRLATHYYKMRDTNYSDLITEQGAVRQMYKKAVPDDVIEIIDKYRHRIIGCR